MNAIKNLRTEELVELKKANNAWTECITKNFMGKWLAGESITIDSVCTNELSKMNELNDAAFEKNPIPFKPFTLWETVDSQWLWNEAYLIDKNTDNICSIILGISIKLL